MLTKIAEEYKTELEEAWLKARRIRRDKVRDGMARESMAAQAAARAKAAPFMDEYYARGKAYRDRHLQGASPQAFNSETFNVPPTHEFTKEHARSAGPKVNPGPSAASSAGPKVTNKFFKLKGSLGAIGAVGAAGATALGGYALYNRYKNKRQAQ